MANLRGVSAHGQNGTEPLSKQTMGVLDLGDKPDLAGLPAIPDSKLPARRGQALGYRMGPSTSEDVLDGLS